MPPKRVLVFSPHSDDAEIGVGGYMARVARSGGEVLVALATIGNSQSLHLGQHADKDGRLEEFNAAMRDLGVANSVVLTNGYDGRLREYEQHLMVGQLDMIQRDFRPDEFLIPLPSFHQDHRYCWEAGIAATRPNAARHTPSLVAAYEYPGNSWPPNESAPGIGGGIYVDVSDTWSQKLDALSRHRSQRLDRPGQLIGIEGITALAKLRGLEAGFGMAEKLHCLRLLVR